MRLAAAADSKGGTGGKDGSGNWYKSFNFFSHCFRLCFCLAYVELYGRNSTTGNIAIFPSSQERYPAGGRICPKRREIPIELETVVGYPAHTGLISLSVSLSVCPSVWNMKTRRF
jgi:hypothetical protein